MQTTNREKYRDLGNGQLQDSKPVTGRSHNSPSNERNWRSPNQTEQRVVRTVYAAVNSETGSRMRVERPVTDLLFDDPLPQAALSQTYKVFAEPTEEEVIAFVSALEAAHEAVAKAAASLDSINETMTENVRELEATRNVLRWSNQNTSERGLVA